MALLVTGVLGDEVEVLAADDESSVHLGGNDGAGQDTATDGDETGEGALLVCSSQGMSAQPSRESSSFPQIHIVITQVPSQRNFAGLAPNEYVLDHVASRF